MKRFILVCLLGALTLAGILAFNLFLFSEMPAGNSEQSLRIERGTSQEKIIRELESRGVISHGLFFKAYLLMRHAAGKVRAGDYIFHTRINPRQVLALLLKGDFAKLRITIPEGWSIRQIADHLGNLHLVNPDVFMAKCSDAVFIQSLHLSVPTLEGYLFPDTYEIYKPKNEEEVIQKMVTRFRETFSPEFMARTQALGLSEQQVMTLASIVEKETGNDQERPIIASVFFNRLKKGMALASDPTIIYGITHFNGNLTRADLARPGPYNSYLNPGLPPTPIANPGLKSIRAVLYPAETDYLFFVSKNDGTHYFSRTETEHFQAVRVYQSGRSP